MGEQGENRTVVKCWKCQLTQFERLTKPKCRRCGATLRSVTVTPADLEPPPAPILRPTSDQFARRLAFNIRRARRAKRLSQYQLATMLDVPRTWISRLEQSKMTPIIRSLMRLAEALEIEPVKFFEGISAPPIPPSEWDLEILAAMPNLTKTDRTELLAAAMSLADGQYTFPDWIRL